jgi:outer membrane lipoprotein-sorting protein
MLGVTGPVSRDAARLLLKWGALARISNAVPGTSNRLDHRPRGTVELEAARRARCWRDMMSTRRAAVTPTPILALLAALALGPGGAAATAGDAWTTLDRVRDSLVASGATRADFVQTYVPAGFSSGEKESGELSLALPDCLRWDYREPYSKTFLLCGEVAHYWNDEDGAGRRYTVDRENEPGLDLLLLGVEELKARYRATQKKADGGRVAVELEPRRRLETVASATLLVDPQANRLVGLSYRDREGNFTRFDLRGYGPLARDGAFDPPREVRFQEP